MSENSTQQTFPGTVPPTHPSPLTESEPAHGEGLVTEATTTRPTTGEASRMGWRTIAGILLLTGVLLVGAYFRFAGLNWDSGSHLHPDERFLTIVGSALSGVDNPLDYLRTSRSTLNPYNFGQTFYVYGNLPMTVTRYVAEFAVSLCDFAGDVAGRPVCAMTYTAYDGIHLVGRFLSGLVDVFSILITFLIGRRLYNRWAGLLAALLLALAVMPIQQSHFFTMDNWAAAFTTLALYAAVRAATLGDDAPKWLLRWWVLFGVFLGLAAASRVNIAPLALVINVSAVIWLARRGHTWRSLWNGQHNDLLRVILSIGLAAIFAILTFRVAQPYAFSDAEMVRQQALAEMGAEPSAFVLALKSVVGLNPQFLANMAEIQRLQAPEASFPPALQWVDRPALVFPFTNMVLYGMGITAGLFAWFAVFWALWRMFDRAARWGDYPEWMVHAIPVFWTLLYFLFMGTRWVKSVRYFLPIYPALFIVAGWGLVYLWQRAGRRTLARAAVAGLTVLVILPSFLWAWAFTGIYREPMTRIAASEWIYDNVPSGATLLYEVAGGETRELNLPMKGMFFEAGGVPLYLDFKLPEDGIIRSVRLNYLSDAAGVAGNQHMLRARLDDGPQVETSLTLDGERRAASIELPPTPLSADRSARLVLENGPGAPILAGTSLLMNEHWDDLLPVGMDGRNAYGSYYTEVTGGQRPVTHPDSPEKREEVIAWLDEADYIMISSQRAMWHLPRLPLTYPMMMRYYEALFSGELGFELVAQFHENTRLGPLYISDTTGRLSWGEPPQIGWPPPGELAAEEAFSVYDHPPVWIFRKTDSYSPENTRQILEHVDLSQVTVMNPLEATRAKGGMMLTAEQAATQRATGAYSDVFNVDGLLSRNPWAAALVWLVAVILLGWIAFPVAFLSLGGLPDRGYAVARVLGLLIVSYIPWLLASLDIAPHTRGLLWATTLGLAVLSLVITVMRRHEIVAFLRTRAGYIVLVELLGVALFLLMVAIRLGNPDVWDVIWGGEKPMDLAYFTAVTRSTTFPPYDPWFAGGYINYYYYGFVVVGALAKMLGIVPTMAYNLILPMLFSFTGLGVFCVTHNLVTARRVEETDAAAAVKASLPARLANTVRDRAAVAGLIAVALALLLGNLAQPGVVAGAWYKAGSPSLEELPLVGGVARTLDGGIKVLSGEPAPIYPGDWFWTASRAIRANEGEVQPITEFPYFTFLYADLHAHMISFPLTMLALAWAVGVALGPVMRRRDPARTGERQSIGGTILLWLVGAVAIGALRATNTWDWPTYLLLGALAIAFSVYQQEGELGWRWLGKSVLLAALLFGLSTLAFRPYSAHYGAAYSSVSLWPGSYTPAWDYIKVHGLFLFFVLTHVILEFRAWAQTWTDEGKRRWEPLAPWVMLALGLFVVLNLALLLRGYAAAPIALPLLVASGLLALRPGLTSARRIVLVLMSAALGLTLLVEIIVLDGDIGRMNTVFKFYLQVWLLLSVASGAAAVWAWPSVRGAGRLRTVWETTLAVLVFAALLYPLLATPAKWGIRMNRDAPRTLDGAAFLPYVEYGDTDFAGASRVIRPAEDVAAIEWLQRNVQGTPVIMEAHGSNPYRSIANRITMYTGLPAVVGWDWHQRQQRAVAPGSLITGRIDDVNNFYNTPDTGQAADILDKYDVEYVYVGTLENAYYWPAGLEKFDRMVAEGRLAEVYRDDYARIYQVIQ